MGEAVGRPPAAHKWFAEVADVTGSRPFKAEQDTRYRGLARSGLPDNAEVAPERHVEGDVVDGNDLVPLLQHIALDIEAPA